MVVGGKKVLVVAVVERDAAGGIAADTPPGARWW